MTRKNESILPTVLLILAVLAAGEILCRGLDAWDGYKKYHELLSKTVTWREQAYSLSKPKDVRRIVLLGGSAVYDTVKDYRESWPYLLEQKLKAGGRKIELINMGFYSESSIDELYKLNEFGMALNPDLVIVFDGANDVYNLYHHFDYWKRLYELKNKPIFHQKKHSVLTRFAGSIRKNSALYQRMNLLKRSITLALSDQAAAERDEKLKAASAQTAPAETPAKPDAMAGVGAGPQGEQFFEDKSRWPEIREGYLAIYRENLDKMARLIINGKARGLFIFQPDLSYKPLLTGSASAAEEAEYLKTIGKHAAAWKEIQQQTYPQGIGIMKDIAARRNLAFSDFNELILPQGDVHDLFEGNVHMSAKGRERIAEEIAALIREKRLL